MVPHLFKCLAESCILCRLGDPGFKGVSRSQGAVSMVALIIEIGIFPKGVGEPYGGVRNVVFRKLFMVGRCLLYKSDAAVALP